MARCECRYFKARGSCFHVSGPAASSPPEPPPLRERDHFFESLVVAYAESLARHMDALAPSGNWTRWVAARMNGVGAEQYGDASFLNDDRDLIREAMEEDGDLGVYVVGHIEKKRRGDESFDAGDEINHHLLVAAAHTSVAHAHLRLAHALEQQRR